RIRDAETERIRREALETAERLVEITREMEERTRAICGMFRMDPAVVLPVQDDGRSCDELLASLMDSFESINQTVKDLQKQHMNYLLRLASTKEKSIRVKMGTIVEAKPALATAGLRDELARLLQDQDAVVRGNATRALRRIVEANPEFATAELRDALVPLLQDQDADVRARAAWVLGTIAEANHALILRLRDQAADVRREAAWALEYVVAANHALATVGLRDELTRLLQDQDADVRANAARALGKIYYVRPDLSFSRRLVLR
ncbi:MAG: HEAT repeat domain-containing protein, partial [Holosporales bacterium]|nr:HEAT repeat domain-containing protein [Holosporales bacterium]